MRFGFSEDQELLRQGLRRFLEAAFPPDRARELWREETGRSPELWSELTRIGLPGLLVPEAHGGLGLDEIDLVQLLEETGYAALAEPVISTAAVAAPLLRDLGDAQLSGLWLERIAAGSAVVAVGHEVNRFVSDAHVADLLLLPGADGESLHALTRGHVRVTPQPCNDPSRRIFSVSVEASQQSCVARGERARELLAWALDRGALACAAQQLGICDRLIEMAVRYAGERRQFGAPIGSFQAIKHALADRKVALEYARPLVYRAAHSLARRERTRSADVSMAKAAADEAACAAARSALQVHGALGYTWEQDLHIWMRRAWSLAWAWGGAAWHRRRLAATLLDGQGSARSFGFVAGEALA
ncbi:MAG: acyl-CoA dehydrogenase family protein [Myxococcota bacterium]